MPDTTNKIDFTVQPFFYVAVNGFGSACGVTVLRDIAPAYPELTMVILSELPDNHGPSITNNIEIVIARLAELLKLDHRHTLWIEHYPAGCYGGPATEEFDLVSFHPDDPNDVDWRPIDAGEWAAMSTAGSGFPWTGTPKLRFPVELQRRFESVPHHALFPFKATIATCEIALLDKYESAGLAQPTDP
ncbi:MAG: hypothetical protein AAF916_11855 [Planctomycetota bacterium]